MVSAESHGLENERMSHHRVVLGVLRDVQTSASRSHKSVQTLWCVLKSDEQRVTETSSEKRLLGDGVGRGALISEWAGVLPPGSVRCP